MNLLPLTSGATPAAGPIEQSPSGGEFAALISGLLAGDQQIVAPLDVSPTGASADSSDGELGDAPEAAIGDVPPLGAVDVALVDPPRVAPPTTAVSASEAPADEATATGRPVAPAGGGAAPITAVPGPAAEPAETARAVVAFADTPPSTSPAADPVASLPPAPGQHTDALATNRRSVDHDGPPTAQPSGPTSPAHANPKATADTGTVHRADTEEGLMRLDSPLADDPAPATVRSHDTERLDVGASPVSAPGQSTDVRHANPERVGLIADRVERAIELLDGRPDPKVMTLRLDDLDGLRLTVALRADGIHLTSDGNDRLVTELRAALDTRGFDLAGGDGRRRRHQPDNERDAWRPAPPPNPSRGRRGDGISL